MVMRVAVGGFKDNLDIGVESGNVVLLVPGGCFEVETIYSWFEGLFFKQQMFASTIQIGNGLVDDRPYSVFHDRERDGNSADRTSEGCVEDVC